MGEKVWKVEFAFDNDNLENPHVALLSLRLEDQRVYGYGNDLHILTGPRLLHGQLREGSYWSIRTDLAKKYAVPSALDCPFERTIQLASIATRLKALDPLTQEKLINWGYAITDAATRKFVDKSVIPPVCFSYPIPGV